MREGKARHRHAQLAGIGEARRPARGMLLAEDDVAVEPGERAPAPDMALQVRS